jgi:hypothetical protein
LDNHEKATCSPQVLINLISFELEVVGDGEPKNLTHDPNPACGDCFPPRHAQVRQSWRQQEEEPDEILINVSPLPPHGVTETYLARANFIESHKEKSLNEPNKAQIDTPPR